MKTTNAMKDIDSNRDRGIVLISFGPIGFGVRSLHAYLKAKGIRASIIFLSPSGRQRLTKKEEAHFCGLLKELDVGLAGISVVAPLSQWAVYLTGIIRERTGAPVIWGGAYPTLCPEECLKSADIVCLGEGEEALTELAASLRRSEDFTSISNLWVRSGGRISKNPQRPLLRDVDSLPFNDLGDEDKYILFNNKLIQGDPARKSRMYVARAARGCAFSCGYCSNQALRDASPDRKGFFRRRSPGNIIQELKMAVGCIGGLKMVKIDEVFPFAGRDPWLEEFARRYKKEIGLPMETEWRPASSAFDFDVASMLVRAGLKRLVIGIESGSEAIRSGIFMQGGTNSQLLEVTRYFKAQGVQLRYNFLMDNPFEDDDNRKETFDLIMILPRPKILNLYNLKFYPKTRVTDIAIERGLISVDDVDGKGRNHRFIWKSAINNLRFDRDGYYACLIFFASKNYMPRAFLKIFCRMRFFRKNLAPLIWGAIGLAPLKRLKSCVKSASFGFKSRF
ncbi:cobalamin-dependent protein [bacterium]|nr:cobalamin-dependent protein [bacterium]